MLTAPLDGLHLVNGYARAARLQISESNGAVKAVLRYVSQAYTETIA